MVLEMVGDEYYTFEMSLHLLRWIWLIIEIIDTIIFYNGIYIYIELPFKTKSELRARWVPNRKYPIGGYFESYDYYYDTPLKLNFTTNPFLYIISVLNFLGVKCIATNLKPYTDIDILYLIKPTIIESIITPINFFYTNEHILSESSDVKLSESLDSTPSESVDYTPTDSTIPTPSDSDNSTKSEVKGSTSKAPFNSITPIPPSSECNNKFAVIDIETLVIEGKLYPYAVGFAYLKDGEVCNKAFYIDTVKTNNSTISRSNQMMFEVCDYIKTNLSDHIIYAHNLGKFDAYFLLKPLFNTFGPYQLLIDKSHSIISITLPNQIIFKDSIRILPFSLKDLGKLFETDHQKLDFDHTKATPNTIMMDEFRIQLLNYLHNDVICLIEIMIKASKILFDKFEVDIHNSYSASSLAFLVFRTKYMIQEYIPTLPIWLDTKIRKSYRGGSVDIYKVTADVVRYYDVNSLYPFGMCWDIPYEYLGYKIKPNLTNFFGFAYAIIQIPKDVKVPLVPIQADDGSLFYPTGHLKGLFFSEELKIFIRQGYIVKLLYGYEFSKMDLFSKYVKDIYKQRLQYVKGSTIEAIMKLLLNGLYGYFGRDPNTLSAKFITFEQSQTLMKSHKVRDEIHVGEDLYLVVANTIPDKSLCDINSVNYDNVFNTSLQNNSIKTNVAISSATTSYGRIIMAPFKTIPDNELLYSDTDSVFLTKPLDPKYIDPTILGMMKDELKGDIIIRCLFLEPKLYYYETSKGKVNIKARGVKKGSITTHMIHQLHRGETIHFKFTRLHKSFLDFTIKEKSINYSLKSHFDRKIPIYNSKGLLISYQPKHIPWYSIFTKSNR